MIVMPSNYGGWRIHFWQGKYGGLGHLYAPPADRGPFEHLPYALDNGAYTSFIRGVPFDEDGFESVVARFKNADQRARWIVAPDVVTNATATLDQFPAWRESLEREGFTVALAAQDGMTVEQVASLDPEVLFVGGSIDWKWKTVPMWAREHPRVHVGRVNMPRTLWPLVKLGVESIDGTGWFRGGGESPQAEGLRQFLEQRAAGKEPHVMEVLM